MSTDDEHILREQQPAEALIPALDETLQLSEQQTTFLRHAIRDIPNNAVHVDTEIAKRVMAVQRRAYQTYPYKCIRGFHYVSLRMSQHDAFPHILEAGRTADAPLLLDIGCCMGTDLRYLIHAGYNPSSVIGCDLRQEFIDLGHELYADRDTCSIPFFVGDIFDIVPCPFLSQVDTAAPSLKDVKTLNNLRGRVKYIYAGSLFHLFDEGTQEAIARRLATLLDLTPGSGPAVVFGRHSGRAEEGMMDDIMGRIKFAHSPASWETLWRRISGEKSLQVDAVLRPQGARTWTRHTQPLLWTVTFGE